MLRATGGSVETPQRNRPRNEDEWGTDKLKAEQQ